MRERLLLGLTVLGFVVPNVCLGIFFAEEGFDFSGYFSLWTASTPSTLLVGLCFGLPLFLLMRERALGEAIAPQP